MVVQYLLPYQVLYGFQPPMITEHILPDSVGAEARYVLLVRQIALQNIKQNLKLAQKRMRKHADKKTEIVLRVGDMAYLKLQPYRHNALGIQKSLKLHSKFYGPFKTLQKLCPVAYKLLLHEGCAIFTQFFM
jgi:hypothetical protein